MQKHRRKRATAHTVFSSQRWVNSSVWGEEHRPRNVHRCSAKPKVPSAHLNPWRLSFLANTVAAHASPQNSLAEQLRKIQERSPRGGWSLPGSAAVQEDSLPWRKQLFHDVLQDLHEQCVDVHSQRSGSLHVAAVVSICHVFRFCKRRRITIR